MARFYRFTLGVLLLAIVVSPSVVVPRYLGRGAEPVPSAGDIRDVDARNAVGDAYRAEHAGDLDQALEKYRAGAKSRVPTLADYAARRAQRVEEKIADAGPWYSDLKTADALSRRVRGVALIAASLVFLAWLFDRIVPRKGVGLSTFTAVPPIDPNMPGSFTRSLAHEIGQIARVFGSDQFVRMGVKIVTPRILTQGDDADVWARALSSLAGGEIKTAVGFSAGEIVRYLRNLGTRPESALSGHVSVFREEAVAHAEFRDIPTGRLIAALLARSSEIEPAIPPSQHRTGLGVIYGTAGDARENAERLDALAAVLACKFWHLLTQSLPADVRPGSWQTILRFTRALNALERGAGD